MKLKPLLIGIFILICFFAMLEAEAQSHSSEVHSFSVENLTQQKDVIWGFDFLSDGRILFTERGGSMKIFDPKSKKVVSLKGVPKVKAEGQGGLLDVRLHPEDRNKIYFTYSEPAGDKATTALALADLKEDRLENLKKLHSARAPSKNEIHYGSRIEFDGQGFMFVTIGERNERKWVQDLSYHVGKLLRLNLDGSVPKDNPFVKKKGAQPEIWASGIRSPQSLSRNPETGDLWFADMGPKGGDEINIVKKGANYGWPVVTYGREYYGPKIGEGETKPGVEDPVAYWVPSISPSGIAFYSGEAFPKWKGNLFVGTLSGQHLRRIVLKDNKVEKQEPLLENLNLRFRNVRSGPDGYLYFSTDDGKISRLVPSKP